MWIRTGLSVHYKMFKLARLCVRDILATAKSQYYNNKIKECKGDQKTVLTWLTRCCIEIKLNSTTINCAENMARDFNNFFHQKIMTIRNGFPSTNPSTDSSSVEESCTSLVDTFDPLSVSEIKQLLKRSSNAFCEADPMPTWLSRSVGM